MGGGGSGNLAHYLGGKGKHTDSITAVTWSFRCVALLKPNKPTQKKKIHLLITASAVICPPQTLAKNKTTNLSILTVATLLKIGLPECDHLH